MKQISKIALKRQGAILTNEEMAKILGKQKFRCCCGMGTDIACFYVEAKTENDAIGAIASVCEYYGLVGGGGCFK